MEQLQQHDRLRAEKLLYYKSTRRYSVVYHGFPRSMQACMEVVVTFYAASGKDFRILKQSGSNFLCSEVLDRALTSEKEASREMSETALTPANYRFRLLGTGSVNGRPAYIFDVQPIRRGKFLYKGKIWIDAADFALEKIEAQPAHSPSFWISKTNIDEEYAPVEGFWLPESNRSETKVRFGGTAVLTIDYGHYTIEHR